MKAMKQFRRSHQQTASTSETPFVNSDPQSNEHAMSKSKRSLIIVAFAVTVSTPLVAQNRSQPMPNMPNMRHAPDATADATGMGVVKSIDTKGGTVTISHEPIAALSWPAMTMAFKVAQPDLLEGIQVGSKVEFMLHGKDMSAVITSLKTTE